MLFFNFVGLFVHPTGSSLDLPDWLQVLVACSSFVGNFILQTSAISTTLELIALTKSVTDRSVSKLVLPNPPNSPKTDSGTISVVLIPAVSASHLHTLNFGTSFFQVSNTITKKNIYIYFVTLKNAVLFL